MFQMRLSRAMDSFSRFRPLVVPRGLSWHHRQNQGAGIGAVVQDRVGRLHKFLIFRGAFPGIQIAVEARKIARRYFEPDTVTLQKDVARGPEVDLVFVDVARCDEFGFPTVDARKRARRIPSVRFCAKPLGQTSTSLPVKSVSTAEDLAKRSRVTGPVTSRS